MQEVLTNLQSSDYVQLASSFLGALFAFIFFVLGQLWISSRKERKRNVSNLKRLKGHVASQGYFFILNIDFCGRFEENSDVPGIFINRLECFDIEDNIYKDIGEFVVSESLIKFNAALKVINRDMRALNKMLQQISDVSEEAMMNNRESDFKDGLEKNVDEFKDRLETVEERLKSNHEKTNRIIAEINFTLDYLESYFWKRWHYYFMCKFSDNFRENKVENLMIVDKEN